MAKDGAVFAAYFFECISQSAAHIYISALSFSPTSSHLATHYKKEYNAQLRFSNGQLEDWPPVKKALRGHTSSIYTTTISPSGTLIAAGSDDGTIQIWSINTGELVVGPLRRDAGRASSVTCIAFFPDEDTIASGSYNGTLCIWDCVTCRCSGTVKAHEDRVTSVAVSGDGRNIVSGSWDRTIAVWTADNLEICSRSKLEDMHDGIVYSVALSPEFKSIVSVCDTTIRFWNISGGQLILQGKETVEDLRSVAWSPDGTCVAAVDYYGLIYLWRVPNRPTITHIGQERIDKSPHLFISFSSDGCYIITFTDDSVSLWDVATGKMVCTPVQPPSEILTVSSVFCDGTHITYAGTSSQLDHIMLHVWNIEAIDSSTQSHTSEKFDTCTAFSPDGKYIVSADETLRVWSTETATLLVGPINVHTGYVTCVAFSHDSKHIISGSRGGSLCVWNAGTGDLVHGPWSDDQIKILESVLFSPDGNRIVCGSLGGVYVLSSTTGEIIHALEEHARTLTTIATCVAISPDGSLIASDLGSELTIWHLATGEMLTHVHTREFPFPLAFSPDGKEIATALGWELKIWSIEAAITTVGLPLRFGNLKYRRRAIAFSPSGKHLVSGGDHGELNLWKRTSVDGWSHIAMNNGHSDSNDISSVAFSPDGACIGSASWDSTICLWDVEKLTQWDSGTAKYGLFFILPCICLTFSQSLGTV